VLEFDGGVTDTHTSRASDAVDPLSGFGPRYRFPPASQPQARIPSAAPGRTYDIKYYPRDVRRVADPSTTLMEASFSEEARKQLEAPAIIDSPKLGSAGAKNPDVERYDRTGLRSAMTATHAAVTRELARSRGVPHLTHPTWQLDPKGMAAYAAAHAGAGYEALPGRHVDKRPLRWGYTHMKDW